MTGAGDDERPTSLDYAGLEFDALAIDAADLRPVFDGMWEPLALACRFLGRDAAGCREIAARMADDTASLALLDDMTDAAGWFRGAADVIEAGGERALAAMCRHHHARGGAIL